MGSLTLTAEKISSDIEGFQQRIQDARSKLASFPTSANWKERKKSKAVKRMVTSEFDHVHRLIDYARKALAEIQKEGSCPTKGGVVAGAPPIDEL